MIAIVTGGSKGIGFAIARAFIARGMQVVISARSEKELATAVASLGGKDSAHGVRPMSGAPRTPNASWRRRCSVSGDWTFS